MSDRINELFLFDIYVAIIKIELVSDRFTCSEDLLNDFVAWDSVIREFEIIGEATKILIEKFIVDQKYRIVVDFRNKIIHHYFGIDSEAVWNIIKENLPEFKTDIERTIINLQDDLFNKLITATKNDNIQYSDVINKLNYLERLADKPPY